MFRFFAHGDEFHSGDTTTVEHMVFSSLGYGFINLLVLIIVIGVLRLRGASLGTQLLSAMGVLFVGGIIGYQFAPAIGGLMIALGIVLALGSVLLTIAHSTPDSDD
jgi:hypothetical protein